MKIFGKQKMKRQITFLSLLALLGLCIKSYSQNNDAGYEYAMIKINPNNWGKCKAYYENGEIEQFIKLYPTIFLGRSTDDSTVAKAFFVIVDHMRKKDFELVSYSNCSGVSTAYYIFKRRRR